MVLEIKICSCDQGHMTEMVIMPIYGNKDLKFFILGADDLETC